MCHIQFTKYVEKGIACDISFVPFYTLRLLQLLGQDGECDGVAG